MRRSCQAHDQQFELPDVQEGSCPYVSSSSIEKGVASGSSSECSRSASMQTLSSLSRTGERFTVKTRYVALRQHRAPGSLLSGGAPTPRDPAREGRFRGTPAGRLSGQRKAGSGSGSRSIAKPDRLQPVYSVEKLGLDVSARVDRAQAPETLASTPRGTNRIRKLVSEPARGSAGHRCIARDLILEI